MVVKPRPTGGCLLLVGQEEQERGFTSHGEGNKGRSTAAA